jgi:glycosyltransferase domain-containing protein
MSAASHATQVSVVIPTLNRADFLLRTLRFYADAKFAGKILVGDASGPGEVARVRAFLRTAALDVTYFDSPGLSDRSTLMQLAGMVETPYAVFHGDDDVLLPHALADCVALLEAQRDLASAHGRAWLFTVAANGAYGKVALGGGYRLPTPTAETPRARLEQLLERYAVTLFSVHRTSVWQAMWREVDQVEDRAFGAEILPCARSAVHGRCAALDVAYLLRQVHPARYALAAKAQWRQSSAWGPSFARVCGELARAVREASQGAQNPDAREIESMFERTYLGSPSRTGAPAARPGGLPARALAALSWLPGAEAAARTLQARMRLSQARSELRARPDILGDLDLFLRVARVARDAQA